MSELLRWVWFVKDLVTGIAEREVKLHRVARRLGELRTDSATDASVLRSSTDLHSTLDVISQLKYRAVKTRQKTEHEIEHEEEEKGRSREPVKLPQLPMLPSTIEELKQNIAFHNVSCVQLHTYFLSIQYSHLSTRQFRYPIADYKNAAYISIWLSFILIIRT